MNKKEHQQIHKDLHRALDELVADYITQTRKNISSTSIMEFLQWSSEQVENPTDIRS